MRAGAVVVATMLLSLLVVVRAEAKSPPMTIKGAGLPYTITAPWAEQKAFWDAPSSPDRLDAPPLQLGIGYEVVSWYWDVPLGSANSTVQANEVGVYYPDCAWADHACDRGVVRVTRAGQSLWLKLDGARDAILRRYVTLGRQGALPAEPTALEVLAARVKYAKDPIGTQVAGKPVDADAAQRFWSEAGSLTHETIYPFPLDGKNYEINFQLPEGRTVSLTYLTASGYLIDLSEAGDVLAGGPIRGSKATSLLRALLDGLAPAPRAASSTSSPSSARDSGASIPIWAVGLAAVAGTAGVTLVAMGIAFARRRRSALA